MALNRKAIETLSVNAVKDSIVRSEFLDQFIADNDKEPSWDGFVYIYGDKSKKKSSLKGRMPVQVKGKKCDDHSKTNIPYSMSTIDLRNYLKDGGCVLFVVYIGSCGDTNKIYYTELTPLKLRSILDDAKNQNSKTVSLKEFPSDNNRKATIFLNCLQHCKKQASFTEGALLSLDGLLDQEYLEDIVIPFAGVGVEDPIRAMMNNEMYLYANIKGSSIPHPIEGLPKLINTQQTIKANVTVGGRLFYKEYIVVKKPEEAVLYFGNSTMMTISEQEKPYKISFNSSSKIRKLAKDLDFLLAILGNGYFNIDDAKITLVSESLDFANSNVNNEKEHFKFAKDVVKVLDMLNCSEDIDVKELKNEDWRNLKFLIIAFVEEKPVEGLKKDLPSVVCIKVGKLRFAVYLRKIEDAGKGTYEICDFFKTKIHGGLEDGEGKILPVSQFSLLSADEFLTLSNMDFDALLPSFKESEHHCETFKWANVFLLELLRAYDMAEGERKNKILKACTEFSDWIAEAPDEELDYQIKVLNNLQTVKRCRDLNNDEIKQLYELVANKETREECIVGAYLLLDQQKAAEIHFYKLIEEEQQVFKEYPIYHYWKAKEQDNGQA